MPDVAPTISFVPRSFFSLLFNCVIYYIRRENFLPPSPPPSPEKFVMFGQKCVLRDSRFLATDNIRTSDSIRSSVDPPDTCLDSVTQRFRLSCSRSSSRVLYSGENSEGKKEKGGGRIAEAAAWRAGELRRANNRIRLLFWKKRKRDRCWYFSEDRLLPRTHRRPV